LLRWASFSITIDVSFYRLGAKTKILLVDDDPSALEALSALFEVNGYQVEQASDGVEALLQLRVRNLTLYFQISECLKWTGYRWLAKNVRSNFPSMKIILMTGALPREPNKVAADVGAAYLLSKRRVDDLLAKVIETSKDATTKGLSI
jgi:DNA-binding response OmpR family regulator